MSAAAKRVDAHAVRVRHPRLSYPNWQQQQHHDCPRWSSHPGRRDVYRAERGQGRLNLSMTECLAVHAVCICHTRLGYLDWNLRQQQHDRPRWSSHTGRRDVHRAERGQGSWRRQLQVLRLREPRLYRPPHRHLVSAKPQDLEGPVEHWCQKSACQNIIGSQGTLLPYSE